MRMLNAPSADISELDPEDVAVRNETFPLAHVSFKVQSSYIAPGWHTHKQNKTLQLEISFE